MKKLLKVLLRIIVVLLIIITVGALVFRFAVLPKISEKLENSGLSEALVSIEQSPSPEQAEPTPQPSAEATPQPSAQQLWKATEKRKLPKKATPTPTPTPTPAPSNKKGSAYDRISAVASAKEMSDGLRILSKVDVGYVNSLLSGGLTGAERSELKKYITSRLSGADISRALQLYSKYKGYL